MKNESQILASSSESVVYQTAYLELKLAQDPVAGLVEWQAVYEQALNGWNLERCRQLLTLVRRMSLDPGHQGVILNLEGLLWERWGDWFRARQTQERAVETQQKANYPRGEMIALNALANLLRYDEVRYREVIPLYQRSLTIAVDLQDIQAQAGILNNLGLAQYELGDLEPAQENLERGVELARRQGDREREERALHNLGSLAWSQGRLRDAEKHYTAALEICREVGNRVGEAETLSGLGITWEAQGKWTEAADAYLQAMTILQDMGDHHGQAQVLANLGNVAKLQRRDDDAVDHYESGLTVARSLGDAQLEGKLLGGLADVYTAAGEFAKAEEVYHLALARKAAAGDQLSQSITLMSLAALHHQRRHLAEAEEAYQQALNLAEAAGDRRIPTHAHINLARLAMLQNQADVAWPHLDQAETLARDLNYHEALGDIAQLRGDILLTLGTGDSTQLSLHYAQALSHAANYNEAELTKRLRYIAGCYKLLPQMVTVRGQRPFVKGSSLCGAKPA